MLSHNPNNYHWSEYNISEWSTQYLITTIEKYIGKCKQFDIKAHITQRMGKVGIIYFIKGIIENEKDKIKLYEYDNYSTADDIITNNEKLKYEFINIIKTFELEAIKKYSHKVIENTESVEDSIDVETTTHKNKTQKKIQLKLFTDKSNIINCFTQRHIMFMWKPKNLIMEDVRYNAVDDKIKLNFKMKEWNVFSNTEMVFKGDCIEVEQDNIEENINLINVWKENILEPLSKCFGIGYDIK
ncbi:hypothetical protein SLOPH_1202 [Spraguea lophii 42_110]|uniref:Uncharacterized protein n=1 Tax=Spraguea lophii (strain 42_110) TaxID=1358809 RepID=S7W9H2_SPRLO|nr:hypothetical protein SLOPH_1202 [Spraguea lophii 42_110]